MPGFTRVHGTATTYAFYGLQPVVLLIAKDNTFTASAMDANGKLVTEGGFDKGVKAIETVASIVWLGADQDSTNGGDTMAVIVDGTNFNNGAGQTTDGTYGALKDALVSQLGGSAGQYTITASSVLNGDGTFSFA